MIDFKTYLHNDIINKLNKNKFINVELPTGIGKTRIITKYISENKNKKIGIFTIPPIYDEIVKMYNQINNSKNKSIENVIRLSSFISTNIKLYNNDIDVFIFLELRPSSISFNTIINESSLKNPEVKFINITTDDINSYKYLCFNLNDIIHIESYSMNRIYKMNDNFKRKQKIEKIINKI